MNPLTRILDIYKTEGLEAILEHHQDLWSDLDTLKTALEEIPKAEQKSLQAEYMALLNALSKFEDEMAQKMQDQAKAVDHVQKNTEACLTYSKASHQKKT
jgi:phosphoglycerate-specific signal transduction histidine kinase